MKGCCDEEACGAQPAGRALCPGCKAPGRPVGGRTIRAMLSAASAARLLGAAPRFCRTPGCGVLYFSTTGDAVRKDAARVRVGLKETSDPIPLCYCFELTRADVLREVAETGRSTLPDRITAEVKAGTCACEEKNPSGTCCLGELRRAVDEAIAARATIGPSIPKGTRRAPALAGVEPCQKRRAATTATRRRSLGF